MQRRLSAEARAELELRCERLRFELAMIEGELRTDQELRLRDELRSPDAQPGLRGGWRGWGR